MTQKPQGASTTFAEFVALMALLTSMVALAIDGMLPVLPLIGQDLGVIDPNNNQFVITVFFFGFAVGQIAYGPVSDSTGRKPAIYVGLALYALGAVICILSNSFWVMLVGRAIQGFGAAGPRTVTMAMIRDLYEGPGMARVLSFVMAVFILMPAIAPSLGQLIAYAVGWRAIFGLFLFLGLIGFLLLWIRQPETHPVEKRTTLSLSRMAQSSVEVISNRIAVSYTICSGLVFGAFIGYLVSSQQVFAAYNQEALFPLFFAALALSVGVASIINAKLVMRFGMRPLCIWALHFIWCLSLVFFGYCLVHAGLPPLPIFMIYAALIFFNFGILIGNLMSLAMEPLGHVAGVGAALIGFASTFIALGCGTLIGLAFDGTVMPIVVGFCALGVLSVAAILFGARTETG